MPIELRNPPVETIDGLRPPLAGFPYFANADRFPLEPAAIGDCAVNAWWLADASFLVYGSAGFVEDALARSPLPDQGFRLGWLGSIDENRGLTLSNETALIVVFRGTRLHVRTLMDIAELVIINQSDLWMDSQFLPAVCKVGGHVHSGFLKAFAEISEPLDRLIEAKPASQKLWLAGHSLGGALATLAAAHLGRDAVQGLYTYGCPRVGDALFASALPKTSHFQFVHRDDWVVDRPPGFLGYVHAGTLKHFSGAARSPLWDHLRSGAEGLTTAMRAMARDMRLKVGDMPFTIAGLADHMPVHYATCLWNALVTANQE
jgi:triacylglycerol lipase